jgi:hypothetical protein
MKEEEDDERRKSAYMHLHGDRISKRASERVKAFFRLI